MTLYSKKSTPYKVNMRGYLYPPTFITSFRKCTRPPASTKEHSEHLVISRCRSIQFNCLPLHAHICHVTSLVSELNLRVTPPRWTIPSYLFLAFLWWDRAPLFTFGSPCMPERDRRSSGWAKMLLRPLFAGLTIPAKPNRDRMCLTVRLTFGRDPNNLRLCRHQRYGGDLQHPGSN